MSGKFATQKSFKSFLRDKPKHSEKLDPNNRGQAKKGGGGGSFTWGRPGDEMKKAQTSSQDPNYMGDNKSLVFSQVIIAPTTSSSNPELSPSHQQFQATLDDYALFKKTIISSAKEYLNSHDDLDFAETIKELNLNLFQQDLVYCLIKFSFDTSVEQRNLFCKLISFLFKHNYITKNQINTSMKKLYNQLPELLIDCPNALALIREFVAYLILTGEMDKNVEIQCEATISKASDRTYISELKQKLRPIFLEYFECEDLDNCAQLIYELDCKDVYYAVVKQMIELALDRSNRERELTSRFIAELAHSFFPIDQIERAFSILLERVEDLSLDIPNILQLLSYFLARALVDEALPPSFLALQHISVHDLGAQVITRANKLIHQEFACEQLEDIWKTSSSPEESKSSD